MNKGIKIKQHDVTDCGAACLASICAFYGSIHSLASIRQLAHTDRQGTNILGLIKAAEDLGFSAKGVRAGDDSLVSIPLPAIAHVTIQETFQHYIVIYKVSKKKITIMDPSIGEIKVMPISDFVNIWTGVLVILAPMESFMKKSYKVGNLKRITLLIHPYRGLLLQALVGSIVCSILSLGTSIYIGKITDYVFIDGNVNLLNLMSIIMLALILLQTFIGIVRSLIAARTGQLINAFLVTRYYKHILQLPLSFYDNMRVGEIISRINDAGKITSFINDTALGIVVNGLTLIFTLAFMFIYSIKLTFVTLIALPAFVVLYLVFDKLNKMYQRRIMERSADLESLFVESLNNIGTIKRFGLESFFNNKTENRFVRLLRSIFKSQTNSIYVGSLLSLVSSLVTMFVVWYGSYQVVNNVITPGSLVMFYSLVAYVTNPIISLVSSNKSVQDATIAIDRLFEIMDLDIEAVDQPQIEFSPDMLGDVCFDNVFFRYGTRRTILNGLNMTLKKGQLTAIVGESGTGKTTISSLLLRLYKVESGHITIGDYDIDQISRGSIRRNIAIVPQKVEMFSGNVLENIAVGEIDPDLKKIKHLIDLLELTSLIDALPNGINTIIGERGASLSGGEAQRIAIARALYKDPCILILDEATSSLDSISEKIVKKAIERVIENRTTVIIIAHRLSTVKDADQIFVLNEGVVAENGNHWSLLENGGLYAKLWSVQM